jgi:hypothetical protein
MGKRVRPNRDVVAGRPPASSVLAADVVWAGGGGSGGRPSNRTARSLGTSDCRWELVHFPTGIWVIGEVARGHYSRVEMIDLREKLWLASWSRLEHEVAIATRVPRQGPHAAPSVQRPCVVSSGRYTVQQLKKRGLGPAVEAEGPHNNELQRTRPSQAMKPRR